jgi:hypothetical protein
MKLYIDGSIVDTNSYTGNAGSLSGKQDSIGTYWDNTRNNFTGKIDQFRIYDGEITDDDVTALYAETASQNDDLTLGGPPETIISANANAGFSIVKQTGNGGNAKIPHGLSSAPELIIRKNLTTGGSGSDWWVYCSEAGTHKYGYLNHTDAFASNNNAAYSFAQTAPTATVFSVGNDYSGNLNNEEIIAYCFHSVAGYSKIGSYSGNGSGSGQTITTGFQPDWIILKCTNIASEWVIVDSVRGDAYLLAESAGAEVSPYTAVDFLSTGFKLTGTSYNESGRTFIYWTHKIN